MKTLTSLTAIALLVFGCSQSRKQSNSEGINSSEKMRKLNVERISGNISSSLHNLAESTVNTIVSNFYTQQGFQPVWSNGDSLNRSAEFAVEMLTNSKGYGLVRDYRGNVISVLRDSLYKVDLGHPQRAELLYQIEILLSQNGIQFVSDLKYGFLNLDSGIVINKIDSLSKGDITLFFNAARKNNLDSLTEHYFMPQHYEAKAILHGLRRFVAVTDLSDHTGYMIPNYKTDSATAYRAAKIALIDHGYLTQEDSYHDSLFVKALKQYQILNGLDPDFKIGGYTRDAINTSNYERFLMAVATLERWKSITFLDEEKYIFVNIPAYTLAYYDHNEPKRKHRVVVGAPDTHTPSFSAQLKYLNVNPQWHVPYSISSKEILPYLKKDSSYLVSRGYKLYNKDHELVDESSVDWSEVSQNNFNYRIVQNSGNYNSLGIIAFMFPNEHAVFIHDTPAKIFFSRDVRAFSHGCVRLQDPVDFAGYVLEQDGHSYNLDSVKTMINRRAEDRIYLKNPLNVHIAYFTVQTDTAGTLVFHRDIYNSDKKIRGVLRSFIEKNQDLAQTP